jgi:hypothetical protein
MITKEDLYQNLAIKHYEKQCFDFGDFPPDDEKHFESVKEEFLEGIYDGKELSPKEIIDIVFDEMMRVFKKQINGQ